MKRSIIQQMAIWKDSQNRKPLILRGARQVGKTWAMKEFGKTHFNKVAYINFDNNERMQTAFSGSYDIESLRLAFNAETKINITPQDTLIILDEIQEVPKALLSLKYFYENAPEYAIVAAGSLLGIALHEGTSFPVGKVDFMDLYPMTFREFLLAKNEEELCAFIETDNKKMLTVFKSKYIEYLKQYYFVGGMPEAVLTFIQTNDYTQVRKIQNNLLQYYRQDFSKHAPSKEVPRLNLIFDSIPSQLAKENKKFIFGALKKGGRGSEFEIALQWLSDCGLIHKIQRVKKGDIPLVAYCDLQSFKIYLCDVGLLCAMGQIDSRTIIDGSKIFEEFKGALTEQFVLQQLISDSQIKPYYYSAENSIAEIDFIIQLNGNVIPIEVKATENLQAKSLKVYHQKYQNKISVRTSLSDYRKNDWLTNIPLYDIYSVQFLDE